MSTIKTMDISVSGLNPNNKYKFKFNNKGGNWPVRVTPLSGVFYPPEVKTYVYFCATTGECPESDDNVFYNTPATSIYSAGLSVGSKSLYSVIELAISEYDDNNDTIIYTHPCIVECDECAPPISVRTDSIKFIMGDGNSSTVTSEINGLVPNQSYTYKFDSAGGNWPIKIVPRSGVIQGSSEIVNIHSLVSICASSGSCPQSDPTVLNYVNTDNSIDREDIYSAVSLTITPTNGLQTPATSSFSILCDDCLPKTKAVLPSLIDLNVGESFSNFNISLDNLIIGQEYSYNFNSVDANWPVIVQPISGTLVASEASSTIPVKVTFCPTTGLCPQGTNDVLAYSVNPASTIDFGLLSKRARLKLTVKQKSNNISTYSNDLSIFCNECVSKLRAALPDYGDLSQGNDSFVFNALVSNLIPNTNYIYRFESSDANWPSVIYPRSGVINTTSTSHSFPAKLSFCKSTGVCPSSDPDVLDYSADLVCATNDKSINKNVKLRLFVDAVDYDSDSTLSNELSITCHDCLSITRVSLPSDLEVFDKNGFATIEAELTNLVPGTTYTYNFKPVSANWPATLYPMSGIYRAVSSEGSIRSRLKFCPSTGVCPNGSNGVIPYTIDSSCSVDFIGIEKNAKLRLEISGSNCDYGPSSSNDCTIVCNNCLPTPRVSLPSAVEVYEKNSFVNLESIIENLVPDSTYTYEFKTVSSNWPVLLYPISGTFKTNTTDATISSKLKFCPSTGMCPNGGSNVLSYITDPACTTNFNGIDKNVRLKLQVSNASCDHGTVLSNDCSIICNNCLPYIEAELPRVINMIDGNPSMEIETKLRNLNPGSEYTYKFESISSNWPTILYPQSGTIRANSPNESLFSKVTFCPSTGTCPNGTNGVMAYSVDPTCISNFGAINKNTKLKVQITDKACSQTSVYSNESVVSCPSCLKTLSINQVSNATLNLFGSTNYELNTTLNNLIPGETYKYTINRIDSNWPAIVSRQSGVFKALGNNKTIKTDVVFCYPTGACVTDSRDVFLDYKDNSFYENSKNKFITLNMAVEQSGCTNSTVISNDFTLSCQNCLPISDYIVAFSGAPVLTLPNGCCSGTKLLSVNINNAIPFDNHTYQFISSSPDIVVSPSSGTIVFSRTGSSKLLTVANINLSSQNQGVIQFKLTNTSSNLEAMDYLAVRCGSECV